MDESSAPDPKTPEVLGSLQAMFAPHGMVKASRLDDPQIVEEFRPGSAKDTDLADVPRPATDYVFAVNLDVTPDGGRLCAVVFRRWTRLAAFYNANPALAGTLITIWHGAAATWMRVTGQAPREFTADGVHWCFSGAIPVGCPKQSPETFVPQAGEIKAIKFEELVWSERQQAEVERLVLEAEVGPPFRVVARGRRVLNLGFWAKYFTGLIPISYDPARNLYTWGDPKVCEPVLLTADQTIIEFSNLLQAAAPSFGAEFPQGEIRPARVRQLVERIKLFITKPHPSDDQVLDAFLASEVVSGPGKNITSLEFRAAFEQYCAKLIRVVAPTSWFYRRLGPQLRAQFGVYQRHDIERNGKSVRGYCGLAFKTALPFKTSDTPDATDGADAASNTSP